MICYKNNHIPITCHLQEQKYDLVTLKKIDLTMKYDLVTIS